MSKVVFKERGYLIATFPQGRDFDRNDIESVIQIRPEQAISNPLSKIMVGRADDADVDLL